LAVGKFPDGLGLSKSEAAATRIQIYSIEFKDGQVLKLHPLLDEDAAKYLEVPPTMVIGEPLGNVGDNSASPPCDQSKPKPGETCPAVAPKK